jgi:hypothetical protein
LNLPIFLHHGIVYSQVEPIRVQEQLLTVFACLIGDGCWLQALTVRLWVTKKLSIPSSRVSFIAISRTTILDASSCIAFAHQIRERSVGSVEVRRFPNPHKRQRANAA